MHRLSGRSRSSHCSLFPAVVTIFLLNSIFMPADISAQSSSKLNIILISEDQLAAGNVSCYGYPRTTTPNLDMMAGEGVLFENFYASGSWTTPSYCSIMTGLYPSRHRMTMFVRPGAPLLDPKLPLLAEQFAQAGYTTVAFNNNGNAGEFILGRGFKEFYQGQRVSENITERESADMMDYRAPGTNEKIFQWLNKNRLTPFFMFILYFEPHSPYDPPPEHDVFKSDAYPDQLHLGYDPDKGKLLRWANAGDSKAVQRLIDLYDGKVHFIDHHFGNLMRKLESLGLEKNTVVILLSDHGELLYSHRDVLTFDHRSLYDTNIKVPLVVKGPGIPAGRRIREMASLIDIAPTVLDIAGLPPMDGVQGKSLLPLIRGDNSRINEYIFSEQDVSEPMRSVRDGRYKLIYHLRSGEKQLFDYIKDPGELHDIAGWYPGIASQMFRVLEKWMTDNHPVEVENLNRWRRVITDSKWTGTLEGGVQITDDVTIGGRLQLNGNGWKMADGNENYRDACYWIEPGSGSRSALWRTDRPLLGKYNIYLWNGRIAGKRAATDANFTVVTRSGKENYRINQNVNTGEWKLLCTATDPYHVSVTDKADGPVIIDAVKFERVGD